MDTTDVTRRALPWFMNGALGANLPLYHNYTDALYDYMKFTNFSLTCYIYLDRNRRDLISFGKDQTPN